MPEFLCSQLYHILVLNSVKSPCSLDVHTMNYALHCFISHVKQSWSLYDWKFYHVYMARKLHVQQKLPFLPSMTYDTCNTHYQHETVFLTLISDLLAIVLNALLCQNVLTKKIMLFFWYQDGWRKWSSQEVRNFSRARNCPNFLMFLQGANVCDIYRYWSTTTSKGVAEKIAFKYSSL